MAKPTNVLCVCLGNSDRSPFMKAFLEQMLRNQGTTGVNVESAGVSEHAKKGGPAPAIACRLAATYGLDLSGHDRRHVDSTGLGSFDLIIAAEKEVQGAIVGHPEYNGQEIICLELHGAANAWMVQNPAKVAAMVHTISDALYREVISYKFQK